MNKTWIAACGDIHAGSTIGICPADGIPLDDGGRYTPSKFQLWLCDGWHRTWDEAAKMIGGDPWRLVINGDAMEGDHHGTPQIISKHPAAEFRGCLELLRSGPLKYQPDWVDFVRGTEAHVGKAGSREEALAAVLGNGTDEYPKHNVIKDPATNTWSTYWRRFRVHGHLVDVKHHGRMGQRAHTKESYSKLYAHDIWEEHVRDGDEPPALCIRGHYHTFMDSGQSRTYPRVVNHPCWQGMTSHTHRISIESLPDFGIVLFEVTDKRIDVHPILFKPSRPEVL